MSKFMNDLLYTHTSRNGTTFECKRCDFRDIVYYYDKPKELNLFLQDVSEMIAQHAMVIWPELNGFQGYDTITYIEGKGENNE